jgi:ferredoxin
VRAALGPEWLGGGPLLKSAPVWDERRSVGAVMLDAGDSAPRALLEALARSLPETITLPAVEPRDDSAPADPPETAGRSLTIRIEAPDGWGESLAARVASTVCRLGTVDAIGGPATDAHGARVGTTVELSTGPGRLDAARAEADVLIVPTAGGLAARESLPPIARGGALVMQTPGGGPDAVWDRLSEDMRSAIESSELSVYGVDARHRPPSSTEDAIPLADAVSAVFEGAVFEATGALARLGIDAGAWERTLAEDPLQAYRKRGADTVTRIEPVPAGTPEAGIAREPDAVDPRPRMPIGEPMEEDAARSFWLELDQFQRSGLGGGIGTSLHGTDLYPALLASYRDLVDVRYAYPLWVAEPEATVPEPMVRSLGPLLEQAVNHHAPEESGARALKDNLLRLEQRVRDELDGCSEPRRFRPTLESAVQAMLEELAIPGEEGQALANDAAGMLAALPEKGWLIGYSPAAPLVLLRACLEAVHSVRLTAFRSEARSLRAQLRDLLKIEEAKAGPGKDPGRLTTAFGGIADILNPESVSEILPKRSASEAMTSGRLGRICHAEATLAAFEEAVALHGGLLVRPEALKSGTDGARESTPWILLPGVDSCAALIGVFEGHMATMARWFAAAHVARLEIADSYVESTHDDYFAAFDWRNFTDAELALAAPVVLVEEEERLGEQGLQTLSRLLLSGRPVKVLVLHRRTEPHVAGFESGDDPCPQAGRPAFHFRRELDHLAVAHPEAFVLQSSPVDPEHLVVGYRRGLEGARPAIFRVFAPAPGPSRLEATSPFLKAGAALDGRDFPLFSYDPDRAAAWGDRFDVSRNPEPGENWPTYDLEALDENGEPITLRQAFTFADFAAQDPAFFGQIRHVPRPLWNDDMIPLDDYLSLPPGETGTRVPYFWMVDAENVLQRVVPSHALVLACRDRLNHWHILQELGGIKNPHAERAAREAREEARVETEREIEALRAEHAAELERVREATAREAMAKLADVLLDLDLDAAAAASTARSPAAPSPAARATPPAEAPPAETPPPEAADEDEDELVSDEPWLETFRCTSCNECIDINPIMFKYNADKLATIADPRAGTYAELVKAAEKCPARCIHPGKPLNPDEPGLEDLTKRAEKFS